MAEWLSTEFFHHVVATPYGTREYTNSELRNIQASLADCSQHISRAAENKNHAEDDAEQQFGSKKLTHKIDLKKEKNRSRG